MMNHENEYGLLARFRFYWGFEFYNLTLSIVGDEKKNENKSVRDTVGPDRGRSVN